MSTSRVVRAPRGTQLTCKNWLSEAAYRMIQNNLDPEVARSPKNLLSTAGVGKPRVTGNHSMPFIMWLHGKSSMSWIKKDSSCTAR